MSGQKISEPLYASYKMVDTCAAEFAAQTPYFYSTYDKENEALLHNEALGSQQEESSGLWLRPDPYRAGN